MIDEEEEQNILMSEYAKYKEDQEQFQNMVLHPIDKFATESTQDEIVLPR